MYKFKKEQGITLVALIITIIVLLILAVVTIAAVTGDGILGHARNARDEYQEGQDVENNTIGNYVTYLDEKVGLVGSESGTIGESNNNNNNPSVGGEQTPATPKPDINYIGNGAGIEGAWQHTEDGKNVTNGTVTLAVGDIVGEDVIINGTLPTLGGNNKWGILGAEDGKLLLTTTSSIGYIKVSASDLTFVDEEISKPDGTKVKITKIEEASIQTLFNSFISDCGITVGGTIAESVRSIDVDDINRVTKYNPETAENGEPYGDGSVMEYGNIVTYEAEKPIITTNGSIGTTYSICRKPKEDVNSVFSVKCGYYYYEIFPREKWSKLLVDDSESSFWLASPYEWGDDSSAHWGLRILYSAKGTGSINYDRVVDSFGDSYLQGNYVRAVISLKTV